MEDILLSGRPILVIGAHAFDAEVMAGPLAAAAAARGATVTFLHLSLGEQGHSELPPDQYAEQKRQEAAAAAAVLGVRWQTLDLPDAFVPDDDATALRVCDVVREVRPEVVIGHWHGSWHKDHRAAHRLATTGVFFAGLPTLVRQAPAHDVRHILFGENWEDDEGFRPEHLVDVTPGFDLWRAAVAEYALGRGLGSFPYVDYYSALYRMRGCLRGTTYAQGFASASLSWAANAGQFLPPRPST
ncbi:PIG-L deacetylase family protein [Mycobacterium sp. KBS0706]|uniref:PIG-L deacetylase family protein n=1 Tax=Mycobacterium sp. KBS0706 TaxID=2578109 RepID=UPI001C8F47B5|nr:PIG-L family deacetylase [Mycobacterium sp. KBS0706]